ncbi:MAG TPA: rRNA maturation RNase YbeY [Chloroflexota bacterium]|nr:rRNA maturation RNase YbeY [Chloroflexota bacterium]HEX2988680.1 rRNA maturation RNase YbeY [Chloroflexota bacterium]
MSMPDVVVEWEVEEPLEGKVNRGFLEGVVREALAGRNLNGLLAVGLTITDDEGIRELNRDHRGLDSATDVLSFPLQQYDAPEKPSIQFPQPPGEPLPLGDIVVSYPRAEEQAHSYGHSLDRELAFLVVHGIMHLMGYDHEVATDAEKMRAEEEAVLGRLGLTR